MIDRYQTVHGTIINILKWDLQNNWNTDFAVAWTIETPKLIASRLRYTQVYTVFEILNVWHWARDAQFPHAVCATSYIHTYSLRTQLPQRQGNTQCKSYTGIDGNNTNKIVVGKPEETTWKILA